MLFQGKHPLFPFAKDYNNDFFFFTSAFTSVPCFLPVWFVIQKPNVCLDLVELAKKLKSLNENADK